MLLVRCISERKSMPGQIVVGKKYWIDEKSAWKDHDGDEYAQVYLDETKENRVGELLTSHFTAIYRQLNHGISLEECANTHTGLLLKDIIKWCENNTNHAIAGNIMHYIKDNNLDLPENMEKDFVVNSVPAKEFIDRNAQDEYMKYMGYSLYCIE